jgi:CRP-like cAMP-binding protein
MTLAAPARRRSVPRTSVAVGEVLGLAAAGPAARTFGLRTGLWDPAGLGALRHAPLPLLVVEGAVLRSVALRGREAADLLGAGDLLRLDVDDGAFATRFRALTPCRVAVLDDRVQAAAAADPALTGALVDAALRRADALAAQVVLAQVVAIDDRLRVLFPALAERWGRVTGDGVVLPSFLSHTVLAALVGARRPSLTAAVARLVEDGTVRRLPDRRWLLAPGLAAVA